MIDYREYQPKTTSRVREAIEWSTTYTYNTTDTDFPRVLLIGDSICNGYQSFVREYLSGAANVTFWASSKCVTDRDYFRELDFILDSYPYTLISFNNAAHSFSTDVTEWEAAYRAAIRFIRAKFPQTPLVITLATALNEEKHNNAAKRLNAIAVRTAAEFGLDVIDLFTPTDALDKNEAMSDIYHYREPARRMQAGIIADYAKAKLNLVSGGKIK